MFEVHSCTLCGIVPAHDAPLERGLCAACRLLLPPLQREEVDLIVAALGVCLGAEGEPEGLAIERPASPREARIFNRLRLAWRTLGLVGYPDVSHLGKAEAAYHQAGFAAALSAVRLTLARAPRDLAREVLRQEREDQGGGAA